MPEHAVTEETVQSSRWQRVAARVSYPTSAASSTPPTLPAAKAKVTICKVRLKLSVRHALALADEPEMNDADDGVDRFGGWGFRRSRCGEPAAKDGGQ
jgi:hypothetical protein